ncbi:MAG: PRC-barrel domain-containing protein [Solirubrobacteraceae bacterium]
MDEGRAISYEVLDEGVPVYGSDGVQVGTVGSVIAAREQDIFHGIVIATAEKALHFAEAAEIATIHEGGVDLRIDSSTAALLPPPQHGAPVFDAEDPAVAKGWKHWSRRLTGRGDWNRER